MTALKYENTAQIGDTIRAYDHEPFEGRRDRYVEGVVIEKGTFGYGYKAYLIKCTADATFTRPDHNRIGEQVIVPFESDMDYEGRVALLEVA